MNYFAYLKDGNYPTDELFSAEKVYPEYIFDAEALSKKNDVYRMIRDIFIKIGLDKENIGTKYWNPLGRYISEGDTVLVKPNLVNHINVAEDDMQRGMDCLITHPSVVRCIFDYVYIALKGKGKIIIADAPVQNCDFDKLLDNSGYRKLFEYLKSLQTPELTVEIGDLRGTILVKENGCQKQIDRENVQWRGRIIDLKSALTLEGLLLTGVGTKISGSFSSLTPAFSSLSFFTHSRILLSISSQSDFSF